MAFCSCLCHPQLSLKISCSKIAAIRSRYIGKESTFALKGVNTELFGKHVLDIQGQPRNELSFLGGSTPMVAPNPRRFSQCRKSPRVYASWWASPQLASNVFTLGTAAVLPFYTLMVVAPKANLTRKCMDSSIPYIVLGVLYAYLLYLSWTPDTIQLMFASKYWLPELPGIAKMFSNEMTLASAWIHLLVVDLFAARQIYHDGLENEVETRHSVSFCLLFCPIGIATHAITKTLTSTSGKSKREIH